MFGRVNARLIDQLYVLFTKDSLKLMRKFKENRQQLNSLMNLVNAIKKGEQKKIKEHADNLSNNMELIHRRLVRRTRVCYLPR